MTNRWGNNGNNERLYFEGFQNPCNHEITRRLFLGRKAMTNLNSVLKSRDITLPPKVKAMVFPVVIYGCDSWIHRKLSAKELMPLNCAVGEDS